MSSKPNDEMTNQAAQYQTNSVKRANFTEEEKEFLFSLVGKFFFQILVTFMIFLKAKKLSQ